ncbi:MAG: thioredoxin domain-containing protein [Candidatus Methanoperedens sp.]|nr:thioredoxin domain-containing protein [Candidatus Methanoperedens sp.]MCZ7404210.1 thioredoxin domain-containing protein [Candidatus Methanoperedens sp.]
MAKKKKQKVPEKKSNKTIIYVGLAVVFIAVIAIYFTSNTPQKPLDTPQVIFQPEPGKVKVVEFMKFDCPHCYDLHQELPRILEKYGSNVTITYVPIIFPGQSTKSIEAYIIADQMGKGAEMQDALFNEAHAEMLNRKVIGTNLMVMESVPTLESVAARIELGADFNSKLEGGDAKNAALSNLALMAKYGVDSTPTIFVNGKQIGSTAAGLDASLSSLLG